MRKNSLPRVCRLNKRSDFVRLFEGPKVHRGKVFQAFWKKNEKKHPRLGITIKGKLTSVTRTKIKRVVREWFRKQKNSLDFVDLNIVIKYSANYKIEELKHGLDAWIF